LFISGNTAEPVNLQQLTWILYAYPLAITVCFVI